MRQHTGKARAASFAVLATLALVAASCSSDDDTADTATTEGSDTATTDATEESTPETSAATEESTPETTAATEESSPETTAATDGGLGEPNPATDTPITIGFISDGETQTVDHTNLIAGFNATVDYANEYLGGINGHEIEVVECSTDSTPAGATQCAVELASAGVAAALVPVSNNDGAIFEGLAGSGIPYFTYSTATQSILLGPGAFVLTNPIAQIAAPALIAEENGGDKVGFIIIDVPAATGPISAIAQPIFANAGMELQIIPISPQVADMTPQLQEAITGGADLFAITGTTDFVANALLGLDQLGFEGDIMSCNISPDVVAAVGDVVEGVIGSGSVTDDPADADVALFHAIIDNYAPDTDIDIGTQWAFASVLSFVQALTGVTDAVDAPSITAALECDAGAGPAAPGRGHHLPVRLRAGVLRPEHLQQRPAPVRLQRRGPGRGLQLLVVPPDAPDARVGSEGAEHAEHRVSARDSRARPSVPRQRGPTATPVPPRRGRGGVAHLLRGRQPRWGDRPMG